MSDLILRGLAAACAPRIADKVEAAVVATVRAELPSIVEAVLREQYAGETLRLYIPRKSVSMRRMRDEAIRAKYNGLNVREIAREFGLSPRMVFKIVGLSK